MNKNEYRCKKCSDVWEFCPEDYEEDNAPYPDICPLCDMPITQMISDVYKDEGIIEVIRRLFGKILWLKKIQEKN